MSYRIEVRGQDGCLVQDEWGAPPSHDRRFDTLEEALEAARELGMVTAREIRIVDHAGAATQVRGQQPVGPIQRLDVEALQALGEEADALVAAGRWDRAAFDRLWKATEAASGGYGDAFASLIRKAEPGWLKEEG